MLNPVKINCIRFFFLTDITNWETRTGVVVLSYSRYCRYRSLIKRLEGCSNEWLTNDFISALGGFTTSCRTTKILFCKDTFDYPDLEGHELLCNHLGTVIVIDTYLNTVVLLKSTFINFLLISIILLCIDLPIHSIYVHIFL